MIVRLRRLDGCALTGAMHSDDIDEDVFAYSFILNQTAICLESITQMEQFQSFNISLLRQGM